VAIISNKSARGRYGSHLRNGRLLAIPILPVAVVGYRRAVRAPLADWGFADGGSATGVGAACVGERAAFGALLGLLLDYVAVGAGAADEVEEGGAEEDDCGGAD
jgi:hypothetical protein